MNKQIKEQRRDELVARYIDIESLIHDIADMARISDVMMERLSQEMTACREEKAPASVVLKHLENWQNSARFAASHLLEMSLDLKKRYLEPEPV